MKNLILFLALSFASAALAQTPPPPPSALFSCSTDAVAVRIGGQTNPGTDVGCSFNVKSTFAVESHNLLTPGNGAQDYLGGVSWTPNISSLVTKTNIPKNTFQPFLHAAVGIARTVPAIGPSAQHYGAFAGGGFRYDPTGSGKFSITLARIDWYNHPGAGPHPNGLLFSAGLTVVLGSK